MIVKNRLLNFGDNVIYQDDDGFLFSLDSVLLANFVTIKLTDKKIIDLCSGNGPVPMLMSFRTSARIFGVELQRDIYELGFNSVCENGMSEQITLYNMDIKRVNDVFSDSSFDVVTCNPPYFKASDDSYINVNSKKAIARHEVMMKLEDVLISSKYLLKNGGTLAMVHRPSRLIEIIDLMRKYQIEPKKIQFVYPRVGKECNMVLIEGVKNGKSGLKILNPVIVHNDDGNYTLEIKKMFGKGDNDVAK